MISKRRKRCNDPNVFRYICGDYTVKEQRKPITDFVKRAYYAYFASNSEIRINPGLRILSVKPA